MNALLHVVRWLHQFRAEGLSTTATDSSTTASHLKALHWLTKHRIEETVLFVTLRNCLAVGGLLERSKLALRRVSAVNCICSMQNE
jgi:hypothetical protein